MQPEVLAYRGTLAVFPFLHQRVDYSMMAEKEQRDASVAAFKAELKTIAERRAMILDSPLYRYDWSE